VIVNKLGIRGKVGLLLALPLAAVVLIAVPFVAGQVQNARSATTTADAARDARAIGALMWELQRERLLSAGHIAVPNDDGVALRRQQQTVDHAASAALAALGPAASDELAAALTRVGSLNEVRDAALQRGVSLDSVARAYHAVIESVIDALRLVPQRTSDAEGTRELTALDALLRANEEGTLRDMAMIAAALTPQTGMALLTDASSRAGQFTERFIEQADVDQAAQVVTVDQGDIAQKVNEIAKRLPDVLRGTRPALGFVTDALSAVDAQAGLRRLVQDRVTGEIADAAAARASGARRTAWTVGLGIAVTFLVVMALTVTVSRSIVRPLRRVTRAATSVADLADTELVRVGDVEDAEEEQPPRLAAIEVASSDEVGELAAAFNRVQATAALLVERQMVSRRNVGLMFINVAHRTRNLVGRQLAVIDQLERNEQDTALLANLYRLDHLSTRLRRNAENLLVLAGSREEARIKRPTPLVTVLRAALTEIEDYKRVRFGAMHDLTLAPGPASDLVLLFAELLENATGFSPPESPVEIGAELAADRPCQVTIIDHGIGLSPSRMAEENRRLVERERLDIAPTSVLGLFVVGRLARRHGLSVELSPTAGGGTTATVTIPAALFRVGVVEPVEPFGHAAGAPAATVRAAASVPLRPAISSTAFVVPGPPGDGFAWFSAQPRPAISAAAPEYAHGWAAPRNSGGASSSTVALADGAVAHSIPPRDPAGPPRPDMPSPRVPGAQLPLPAPGQRGPTEGSRVARDAASARARMADYETAVARASASIPRPPVRPAPPVPIPVPQPAGPPFPGPVPQPAGPPVVSPPRRDPGLGRRVPGAHLAPELVRDPRPGAPARRAAGRRTRDPAAERDAFDSYSTGWARAGRHPAAGWPDPAGDANAMKEGPE
jgi:signal transduction histidine kinase